ncbi:hypothetical protein [Gloeobacter violaceus]|nr:hypothetical protein [Gloeobacter violaceus]
MLSSQVTTDSECWTVHQTHDEELERLGRYVEGELLQGLNLVQQKEQRCLSHYREWCADQANNGKRARFVLALCELLELWPKLEHLSSDLADMREDLGF